MDPLIQQQNQQPIQQANPVIPQQQIYTPGQNFQFNPNMYLPQIQQTAQSIYSPQQAQIQALSQLGKQQAEQTKVTTNEQFDKELKARIEAINQRGAFFGGGAIEQQNQLGTERTRALSSIDLQNQAQQAGYLAQQAGLNAQQAQYIQDQLSNAQGVAYSQWKDQYAMYQDEQARQDRIRENQQQQANIDREYTLKLKQLKADAKLSKKQVSAAKKQAKAQAQIDKQKLQLEAAKLKGSGGGKSVKNQAYINAQGEIVPLNPNTNYVGGLSLLNKSQEKLPWE